MSEFYLSAKDLSERYGVTRKAIWVWAANGKLPTPINITNQTTRWKLSEIERFEQEREAAGHQNPQTKIAGCASARKRKAKREQAA